MKRCVIFAHFDKFNKIEKHVIYYLNELKKSVNTIVFVSDSDLPEEETSKLAEIAYKVIAKQHGEYDWGSYKYGYIYLQNNGLLDEFDELFLCNDSVFGPIRSIDKDIEKMSNMEVDFSGFVLNKHDNLKQYCPHLQSWFLLLKKKVFISDTFKDFLLSVKQLNSRDDVVTCYEIGFTQKMSEKFDYGYLYATENYDLVYEVPLNALLANFPFLKVNIAKIYQICFFVFFKNPYLYGLIRNYLKQNKIKNSVSLFLLRLVRMIYRFFVCKVEKSNK